MQQHWELRWAIYPKRSSSPSGALNSTRRTISRRLSWKFLAASQMPARELMELSSLRGRSAPLGEPRSQSVREMTQLSGGGRPTVAGPTSLRRLDRSTSRRMRRFRGTRLVGSQLYRSTRLTEPSRRGGWRRTFLRTWQSLARTTSGTAMNLQLQLKSSRQRTARFPPG